MFEAYPERPPRIGGSRCCLLSVVTAFGIVLACAVYSEHLLSARPIDSRDLRGLNFLQPFVASTGFEVGFWTRHSGGTPSPQQAVPSATSESGPAQLAAAQREVQQLKEELEAERKKRSVLPMLDQAETAPESKIATSPPGSDATANDLARANAVPPPSLWRQPPGHGEASDGGTPAPAVSLDVPIIASATAPPLLDSIAAVSPSAAALLAASQPQSPPTPSLAQPQAQELPLGAAPLATPSPLDASQGTSITVKAKGQSITITIAKDEPTQPLNNSGPAQILTFPQAAVGPAPNLAFAPAPVGPAPILAFPPAASPSTPVVPAASAAIAMMPAAPEAPAARSGVPAVVVVAAPPVASGSGAIPLHTTRPPVLVSQVVVADDETTTAAVPTTTSTAEPITTALPTLPLSTPTPEAQDEDRFANVAIFGR